MLMYFKNIKQPYVLVADIEYDINSVLQCAGLIFKLVDEKNYIYQLAVNFNWYIKVPSVDKYATKYTGLTAEFLNENGISKEEFITTFKQLISNYNPSDMLFVSHGSNNDRLVMKKFGIDVLPLHSYCTYKNARRILNREKTLTLANVAEEAGFKLFDEHDAHSDALATAAIFSFLQKIENAD
jgi:DNA polymerase III epsilon subunit-like protein